MSELITSVEQATPAWLTEILRQKGFLSRGSVTKVRQTLEPIQSISSVYHLTLDYSPDAPDSVPTRLLLKIFKTELNDPIALSLSRREVGFYNLIAPTMPDPPLVRCYDAVDLPQSGGSHLLLDDLSPTHFTEEDEAPATQVDTERALDALAQFHAYWWSSPRLGQELGEFPNETALDEEYIKETTRCFPIFVEFMQDRLSTERRQLYEEAIALFPAALKKRVLSGKNLTLVHQDAHIWNFLLPRDPQKDRAYIIDWQQWTIDAGPRDVAYMIALWWYPERRQALEKDLVRHYHNRLLEHGIESYSWDECWNDYRLYAVRNLFNPVWAKGTKYWGWYHWAQIEKSLLAYQDLNCAELLKSDE